MNKKATQKSIQEQNIGLIIKNIIESESSARINLSQNTKLAKSTISVLTRLLIDKNIIYENKKAESKIGKKPTLLEFNKKYCFIIAINIGVDTINGALVNIFGEKLFIINKKNYPKNTRSEILNNIFVTIEDLLKKANINIDKIFLFSLGTHGIVNPKTKIITNAPFLPGWNGINLIKIFKSKYNIEVLLEKDVNFGAIGEHWLNYKDIKNLIFIDINNGVGAGIILDNNIMLGNEGRMGEIAYLPIESTNNFKMLKKNKQELGIFESQINTNAIIRTIKDTYNKLDNKEKKKFIEFSKEIDFNTICILYNKNNMNFVKNIIDNYIINLIALGIASIIAIIDIEIIIINGDIIKLGNSFIDKLTKRVREISPFKTKLLYSQLGHYAPLEGAIKNGIDYLRNKFYNNFFSILEKYNPPDVNI